MADAGSVEPADITLPAHGLGLDFHPGRDVVAVSAVTGKVLLCASAAPSRLAPRLARAHRAARSTGTHMRLPPRSWPWSSRCTPNPAACAALRRTGIGSSPRARTAPSASSTRRASRPGARRAHTGTSRVALPRCGARQRRRDTPPARSEAVNALHVVDANYVVSGDDSGEVRIWDTRKRGHVLAFKEHEVRRAVRAAGAPRPAPTHAAPRTRRTLYLPWP